MGSRETKDDRYDPKYYILSLAEHSKVSFDMPKLVQLVVKIIEHDTVNVRIPGRPQQEYHDMQKRLLGREKRQRIA